MLHLIGEALFVNGWSTGVCLLIEAYQQRRAMEEVGEHDAPRH
jgi:hypothetical protein